MKIQCPICKEILKTSENFLGKKAICPACFQTIAISQQKKISENVSESVQRLAKKGYGVTQIYKKLMQQNFSSQEAWYFLNESYFLFSDEQKLIFNQFKPHTNSEQIKQNNSIYHSLRSYLQFFLLLGWLAYLTSFILPCVGTYHICDDYHESSFSGLCFMNMRNICNCRPKSCVSGDYNIIISPCPKNGKWSDMNLGYERLIFFANKKDKFLCFLMILNLSILISPFMFFLLQEKSAVFKYYIIWMAILIPILILNFELASEKIIRKINFKGGGSPEVLLLGGWHLWAISVLIISGIILTQLDFKFRFTLITILTFGIIASFLIFLSQFTIIFLYILLSFTILLSVSWIKNL